jgi:hypothetical protein
MMPAATLNFFVIMFRGRIVSNQTNMRRRLEQTTILGDQTQ